jgi:hypothetical protein
MIFGKKANFWKRKKERRNLLSDFDISNIVDSI